MVNEIVWVTRMECTRKLRKADQVLAHDLWTDLRECKGLPIRKEEQTLLN